MSEHRHPIAIVLAIAALGLGCSHEDPRAAPAARVESSGGERRAQARARRDDAREDTNADTTVAEADAPTAMDQSETAEDLEITRQIRAAVISDSSLSFGARNCTIITSGAVVTLRGDVDSNAERDAIDRHAHEVAGVTRVHNMLVVTE